MANEFTSIATGGGIGAELVQPTYDLAVRAALHSIPTARQFVTIRDERPAMRGSSITLEKMNFFAKAAIVAAKTPLTEESDVDSTKMPQPTPIVLTPAEYGFAVTTTRKLRNRVFADFDPFKAMAIALHQARVIDELIQDKLVTGANKVWAGSNTADGTVALTDVLTATASHLPDAARTLIEYGLAEVTPCVVTANGTTCAQRSLETLRLTFSTSSVSTPTA